jgi:hypothetical protein
MGHRTGRIHPSRRQIKDARPNKYGRPWRRTCGRRSRQARGRADEPAESSSSKLAGLLLRSSRHRATGCLGFCCRADPTPSSSDRLPSHFRARFSPRPGRWGSSASYHVFPPNRASSAAKKRERQMPTVQTDDAVERAKPSMATFRLPPRFSPGNSNHLLLLDPVSSPPRLLI